MTKKTEAVASKCAISRKDFKANAKPLSVKIGDSLQSGDPREFSTGSFGWYCGGKVTIEIDGVPVKCQMTCSITVVGSKEV